MEYTEFKTLLFNDMLEMMTDTKDFLRFMYAELDGDSDLTDTELEVLDTTAERLRECVDIIGKHELPILRKRIDRIAAEKIQPNETSDKERTALRFKYSAMDNRRLVLAAMCLEHYSSMPECPENEAVKEDLHDIINEFHYIAGTEEW